MQNDYKKTGFSLVEILIVMMILVVVITAVLVIVNPNKRKAQAQDTKRLVDITSLLEAVVRYSIDNLGAMPRCDGVDDLPADNQWHTIGTMDVTDFTQSDYCAAAWLMDGARGTAEDSCSTHDGAVYDEADLPGQVPDGQGGLMYLLEANDSIYIGHPSDGSLDFGLNSFTYMVRVFATSNNTSIDMPFYKGGRTASIKGYDMELGTSPWNANISDGATKVTATFGASQLNTLLVLTAVVDRENNKFRTYINDQPVISEIDIPSGFGSVSTQVRAAIGSDKQKESYTGSYHFLGAIDEVAIFNTALSEDQITSIYENNGLVYGMVTAACDIGNDLADYLPLMPEDPEEGDLVNGYSGYEIKRDSSDTIYIRAPHQSEYAKKDIQVDNFD